MDYVDKNKLLKVCKPDTIVDIISFLNEDDDLQNYFNNQL